MKLTVGVGKSRFGTPEPEVRVAVPRGMSWRLARAALLRLAADIEEASSPGAGWVVQVDDDRGRVYLELVKGSDREVRDGTDVLRYVCAQRGAARGGVR